MREPPGRGTAEPRRAWPGGRQRVRAALAALALGTCLALPSPGRAASPSETVSATVAAVATVLSDGTPSGVDRQRRVAEIIERAFDFDQMAQSSLGTYSTGLTPPQQAEFAQLFGRLFQQSYGALVLGFLGQRKTTLGGETVSQGRAVVQTVLLSPVDGRFSVDYVLASPGSRWVVVDVIVDGVSLASNYRAQFLRVLRRASYEALLQRIRERLQ